jgi:hypothetical protein
MPPDAAVPDAAVPDAAVPDIVASDVFTHEVKISDAAIADATAPDVVAADPFGGRSFRIDDTNPAPTPDSTCTARAVSSAVFTFSSDLGSLTGTASSGSTAWKFSATAGPEASKLTYHVSNLTGGLIFFERDQGVHVAQVVLYGSGVPVMWCLRGALTPQP